MSDEYSIGINFQTGKISAAEYRRKMARLGFHLETHEPDPRCPICDQFYGSKATRYVDGVRYHRECLGDK